MTKGSELLLRYLDGEMSQFEAERFRARLAETPALRQRLLEMQHVGKLVRLWASDAESRAGKLLEPTLFRVAGAEKRRARLCSGAVAVAGLLLAFAPWSSPLSPAPSLDGRGASGETPAVIQSAAIQRIDSGAKHATVFVVGRDATPVVWLSDDGEQVTEPGEPGPG